MIPPLDLRGSWGLLLLLLLRLRLRLCLLDPVGVWFLLLSCRFTDLLDESMVVRDVLEPFFCAR